VTLTNLRDQIDQIDYRIVALLNKRAAVAKRAGIAKRVGSVYHPARETQVIKQITAASAGVLPDGALAAIYGEIIAACRNLQQPLRVAYLGPEGTYSEEAARKQCGETSMYVPAASVDTAVRLVEAGEADVAVVPIENSTEGAVNRTLDLLLQTPLTICSEILLPIHHQLLSHSKNFDKIDEIISHPQALAQCRTWLDEHVPYAKRTAANSNADAARRAALKPGIAAIAGRRASVLYEVPVLAHTIEDDANNTTRFLVLSTSGTTPTGTDKTSLVCSTPNKPGALHKILAVLACQGVNMVKLESRPSPGVLWDYVFYIDIDGHQADEQLVSTLDLLRDQTVFLKVLGSYPKGK
jgi:chorismate mutase/prephenate dehydratase